MKKKKKVDPFKQKKIENKEVDHEDEELFDDEPNYDVEPPLSPMDNYIYNDEHSVYL